ncbi:fused DSP-PTPase phosphatase/NAD kinase-like protein [Chamaesiphon sp. OTE_75_metabat_556]|uniref:phosphatase domain-containing putative toxin n=1 Tax=Chamaesiphon sp. OTE_75_metabat_556 TaxID=2964692 RepID=UPI00286CE13A|nr:dual specificity protein phosphatase family protein [Chamaesiphon sp. OTE_75_metabat_556]
MESPIQSIEQNLWWVIPGKLAGVRQPQASELEMLKAAGIGAICSVLSDRANLDLYQAVAMPHLWLPVRGGMAPSREQVLEFQAFVDEQNTLRRGVAVHCTGGRHRTGTMLAAYLISIGSAYNAAVQTILAANPEAELETTQKILLRSLAGDKVS